MRLYDMAAYFADDLKKFKDAKWLLKCASQLLVFLGMDYNLKSAFVNYNLTHNLDQMKTLITLNIGEINAEEQEKFKKDGISYVPGYIDNPDYQPQKPALCPFNPYDIPELPGPGFDVADFVDRLGGFSLEQNFSMKGRIPLDKRDVGIGLSKSKPGNETIVSRTIIEMVEDIYEEEPETVERRSDEESGGTIYDDKFHDDPKPKTELASAAVYE